MEQQEWLVQAVENWPITLGFSLVFLMVFLWIFTPFAVFGLKRRLDRMTRVLEEIRDKMGAGEKPPEGAKKDGKS